MRFRVLPTTSLCERQNHTYSTDGPAQAYASRTLEIDHLTT